MKFVIDLGHGQSPDTGADGIRSEEECINEVGNILISNLRKLGHEVIESRPKSKISNVRQSLQARVDCSNFANPDLFVSIHFNASDTGLGHGTEVFAISKSGKSTAKKVVDNIAEIGFKNRGVKDGSHLYLVKNTNNIAILIECCFCDNFTDMNLYTECTAERIANAILKGITA
jgi:N-acetylmuramoyl-L-alanine amidase